MQPGYEDVWYYLWKERRLPVNVDPLESRLDNEEDRHRLAKVFEQGLSHVVGFALPLRPVENGPESSWESSPWFLRQEHMFLIPGDSAMGLRLPLDSLPWVAPEEFPHLYDRDPLEPLGPLPDYGADSCDRNGWGHWGSNGSAGAAASTAVGAAIRRRERAQKVSAACWVPEISTPENTWAARGKPASRKASPRAAAVEQPLLASNRPGNGSCARRCASSRGRQVGCTSLCRRLAGWKTTWPWWRPSNKRLPNYRAPGVDRRLPTAPGISGLRNLRVTPDPGVIEVNMQPAHNWNELVDVTTALYDEAHQVRLGTEKFMLDGRHTGTGGGNHIVLGGATPADSPLLRRPDLLRSLIAYWNNRPSLSYLFSGSFIGPTSQAPRIDEARHESLYELETAFSQIPDKGPCPPWIVDRVFRHLLTDLTGNTHRAEFCIDKLFSPDSSTGRLGLLEFRAFEMPPHARMSLTQQLLMRALIARFWNTPYREPLVHWGTSLHDRWMLPHFVSQDFAEVIGELREAGFHFDQQWFASNFEFRFPLCGSVAYSNVQLELRQAIEPWHVLGEEPGGGGTARYVDSSVERMQVKVRGLTNPRHVVACNGRRVPLHPTGVQGEYVAGVRFRAWQPPNCLHPTIGVHSPLVFDVLDTWNQRSIGGCTWHVAHPGGLNFEAFPINAFAAESRRVARFFPFGHTGGRLLAPPLEKNRAYPFTLDLRRPVAADAVDR